MEMLLSQLVRRVCSKVPIDVKLPSDIDVPKPERLSSLEIHDLIADSVTEACIGIGMLPRSAYAFGEWLAELFSGWSTRYSNEFDVMALNNAFGRGAFNDERYTIRLYLLPSWEALDEYIEAITEGVKEAYKEAINLSL